MTRLDDLAEPSRGRGRQRCTEQPAGWNQLVVALVGGALLEQFDDLLRHIHRATLPRAPRVITSAAQRFMAGRMGAHTCEVAASRLVGVAARDGCRSSWLQPRQQRRAVDDQIETLDLGEQPGRVVGQVVAVVTLVQGACSSMVSATACVLL